MARATDEFNKRDAYRAGYNAGREQRAPSCFPNYYGTGVKKELQAEFIRGYAKGQIEARRAAEK
ncbi:MAG: hypothetical protein IJ164_04285 [Duodenibacillus sp.]|nr:hypothetical protein [Duodenibacillus sp.]